MQPLRQTQNRLKGFLPPPGGASRAKRGANPHRVKKNGHRHANRTTGHSVYANDNPVRFTDPDGRQTQGPKGYGWYAWKPTPLQSSIQWADDVVPGTAGIASMLGDMIALARSDSYNPVANKFMSPGETQNVKYGLLAFAIPGASAEGMSVRSVERVLTTLPRGKQSWVRMAPSEASLAKIYNDLTRKGSPTVWKGWKGRTPIQRPDGAEVGFREGSKSGGSAIDIITPDGKRRRIHVEQ